MGAFWAVIIFGAVLWITIGTPLIWLVVVPWALALVTGLKAEVVYLAMFISFLCIPLGLIWRLLTCNGTCG